MPIDFLASPDATASVSNVSAAPGPFEAVPQVLRDALEARGFSELTAVQRAVLESEVDGRDLQISSQTGSGKTVALGFVLSGELTAERNGSGPEALIIVPTRELATQVCAELGWLMAALGDMSVASVTGGTPLFRDRSLLARRPRLLVGTPGRLLDHVTSGLLDLSSVRELVLDEADQMLDLGFREELEGILDATPTTRRTHLLSATFPKGIQQLASRYQRDPFTIEGTRLGKANEDIEHTGHIVHQRDRYAALVNLLLQADGERTLVFVERRTDALEVASRLEADGFEALPLSGELAQSQRERTLATFRAGRATGLVATDVAARGLDVPDITMVIHTAPPLDSQVYTHRSGRTGRAGKRGRSVLLAPPNRRRRVESLLAQAGVRLHWSPMPTAAEVRARLATRARTALREQLAADLAAGPPDAHLAHAEELLADRDATAVVAALLARLTPAGRVEPQDVGNPRTSAEPRRPQGRPQYGSQNGSQRGPQYGSQGRPQYGSQNGSQGRPQNGSQRRAAGGPGFERFFINWGLNQGATPSRLLAAICRRGEVTGADIGSIAVHPNASTFDVNSAVAERFEHLAGRRDPRDPKTHIRPDRNPRAQARPRRS
ncbi:MAG: hypothetical protein CMJ84_14125 [Planctomycetes bacterium]|nr:hypothetical protein [Planctomycetota bacterium]